jgi:hypothetical protein
MLVLEYCSSLACRVEKCKCVGIYVVQACVKPDQVQGMAMELPWIGGLQA